MAKFFDVPSDIQDEIDSVLISTGLDNFVDSNVLCNNSQKKVVEAFKATEREKHCQNVDLFIIVNQTIFDNLQPQQKVIAIEEALASYYFDQDKDALVKKKADVNTFSGILEKYGYDTYNVLQESIKTLYAAAKGENATT